jgi:hypothetical protein
MCVSVGGLVSNPRRKRGGHAASPPYALAPLISELFAQTDQRSRWLNISDGGHFENLGLYELVRRRCKYIIVGDAEQDCDYAFGSLGGAIRKCRTDFGVDIDLDPSRIRPMKDAPSRVHCVVGTICYPAAGQQKEAKGWILYLKSSLTGDEPEDVAQYATTNPDFPHQSTANQFFTESQFESYRKLGWHVTKTAFENVGIPLGNGPVCMRNVFECLKQQWYPPPDLPVGVASRHNDAYSELMKRLSGDPALLSELGPQLFDWNTPPSQGQYDINDPGHRKMFFYVLELIQLMENVWFDMHLDRKAERDSPRHGGWMSIFARWASQPAVQWTWKWSHKTFNPLFQQFLDTLANDPARYKPQKTVCGLLPEKVECGHAAGQETEGS